MRLLHWLVGTRSGYATLGALYAIGALFVWSLCVAASRADAAMDEDINFI